MNSPSSQPDDTSIQEDRRLVIRIKQDILANRYRPGEWLRLADLEQHYQVSRNEVRKALAALATLQALEHVENYGYRLAVFDEKKGREKGQVRLVLESAAAEWIVEKATSTDIERLRQLAEKFEWSIENADMGEIDLSNHDFHRHLISICGNPTMERLVNELRELVLPAPQRPWLTVSGMKQSSQQHFEMVQALATKDVEHLRRVTHLHISRWRPDPAK